MYDVDGKHASLQRYYRCFCYNLCNTVALNVHSMALSKACVRSIMKLYQVVIEAKMYACISGVLKGL